MKKKLMMLILPLMLLMGCDTTTPSTPREQFEPKTNYGIAPMFDDTLGIYDKDPAIFKEDGKEYAFFTTNETKYVTGDVIGLRIGTESENGETVYDKTTKIVLRASENDWDSMRVSNPDVIKGEFAYQNVTYSYLMAFQGTSKVKDKLYQIGFAVSNDLLNWKKVGNEPIIKYSSYAYGSAYGVGAPSLVSYDQKGKFYCFYTYADALITTTRVSYFDCSSLDDIKTGEASAISSKGLEDKSGDVVFNNADFMIDKESNTIYCVRDRNPVMTMPATSDSIQVAKADLKILVNPNDYEWTLVTRSISDLDTALLDGEESQEFGWERIYSACLISDAYGHKLAGDKLPLAFSVSAVGVGSENNNYLYSGAIVYYEVNL